MSLFVGVGQPGSAWAEMHEVVLDPPVRVTLRPDGGDRLDGDLLRYDARALTVQPRQGDPITVDWPAVRTARAAWVFDRSLRADDARGWFDAAVFLFSRDDQRGEGEKALRKALRADASLEPLADDVRAGKAVPWPVPADEPEQPDGDPQDATPKHRESHEHGAAAGPQTVGDIQAQFWGDLSPELMSSSVEMLKEQARQAQAKAGLKLRLYEDDYFLVYTDLPADEARNWVGLLDDMYDRLVETFDLPKGQNVFRGKCLIYIPREQADYYRLCHAAFDFDAAGTAGLCISYGNGFNVVLFYRQPNTLDFAHVLVHETVHAFVHRYRSHPRIPSWVNEGLAEHIAQNLVQNRGFGEGDFATNEHDARRWLRFQGSMRGMFDARSIEAWQYPVAGELCGFMIAQSPRRYKAFIDAIKDGKPWHRALQEDYGITPERLAEAFGESIDIRNLRP